MVIFLKVTEKGVSNRSAHHSKVKIRLVQHGVAISATAKNVVYRALLSTDRMVNTVLTVTRTVALLERGTDEDDDGGFVVLINMYTTVLKRSQQLLQK